LQSIVKGGKNSEIEFNNDHAWLKITAKEHYKYCKMIAKKALQKRLNETLNFEQKINKPDISFAAAPRINA